MFRAASFIAAAALVATAAGAIEPGEWKTETRTTDFHMELPAGAPPGMEDMIRQRMGDRSFTNSQCLTAEDIDEAPEQLFRESEGQCEYSEFDMSNGQMNAVAQCNMEGQTMTMVMTGTHGADSYRSEMVMNGETPAGEMRITMKATGERVGPCS